MKRDSKIILLGAVVVAGLVGTLGFLSPARQDPTYHRFADQRLWLDIPHAGDVLSNMFFAAAGLLGLVALVMASRRKHPPAHFWRTPYAVFFVSVVLVSFGSAFYHWAPSNEALVWDRLPMSLAFMSLFSAVIAERMGATIGKELFVPLLLVGAVSVGYWNYTGDLRLYGFVQFLPIVLLPLVCWMFPARAGLRGRTLGGLFVLYGLAKVFEHYDHQLWALLGHTVSGHTLKHVFAAGACALVAVHVLRLPDGAHTHAPRR